MKVVLKLRADGAGMPIFATITIQSTPRAYGHFSLQSDTWVSKLGATHEINIGAGTLARPIEDVAATLLHEMVHYYNYENGVKDCSRGNTYHNKRFKESAESHGLIVDYSQKYGWAHTSPSDKLLDFIATMPTGGRSTPARRAFLVLTPKLQWKGNWPDETFNGLTMSGC